MLIEFDGAMQVSARAGQNARAQVEGESWSACGSGCSHCLPWHEMCMQFNASAAGEALVREVGWTRRWSVTWRLAGSPVVCPVRDLASVPMVGCEPVRRFGWRARQRHRPGLQYLVSTRRHHGFESVAEQRLLLVLDFAAGLVDVLSQPFRLGFATVEGWREHTPDFLARGLLNHLPPQDHSRLNL